MADHAGNPDPASTEVSQSELDALVKAAVADAPSAPTPEPAAPTPTATAAADPMPAPTDSPPSAATFDFPELQTPRSTPVDPKRIAMLGDVSLRVRVELGRTRMLVEDVLRLDSGSVVELDRLAGDPVDIVVNNRLVARGEVLVLNDNFCVRVSEVLSNDPHRVMA